MQAINVTVLNRLFLGMFVGTGLLCLVLAVAALASWRAPGAPALLAGALFYILGTFGVTAAGNVPLNERLAEVSGGREGDQVWAHYLERWTRLNTLRTIAALAAAVFLTGGLLLD